jgi:DNA-binding response OmpR family regulator
MKEEPMDSHYAIKGVDILIVEPDAEAAKILPLLLPWGFRHRIVSTLQEAEAILDSNPPSLLMCADDLEQESGLMFFSRTQGKWNETKRILMVPSPDGEFFFIAMREVPPLYYLSKPVEKKDLLHVIRRALHEVSPQEEAKSHETLKSQITQHLDFMGILAGAIVVTLIILIIIGVITAFRFLLAA